MDDGRSMRAFRENLPPCPKDKTGHRRREKTKKPAADGLPGQRTQQITTA